MPEGGLGTVRGMMKRHKEMRDMVQVCFVGAVTVLGLITVFGLIVLEAYVRWTINENLTFVGGVNSRRLQSLRLHSCTDYSVQLICVTRVLTAQGRSNIFC